MPGEIDFHTGVTGIYINHAEVSDLNRTLGLKKLKIDTSPPLRLFLLAFPL